MSKIETNTIEPSTGTTLTLGASGDTLTFPSGVLTSTNNNFSAFAHFFYKGTTITIADNTSDGVQVAFNFTTVEKNITLSTTNNNWTHSKTGYYKLYMRYRQEAGDDYWTVFGILKGGNSGTCVGASARTGSQNSNNEAYEIFYKVDSTSSTYQLNGWVHGSVAKTAPGNMSGGKPGWSGYTDITQGTSANEGIGIDMIIERLGDL